jgi:hypothetical protein
MVSVIPGLGSGIHISNDWQTWMAGTGSAMTARNF